MLVRNNEVYVPAPPNSSVPAQAFDRLKVVGLQPEPVLIKCGDGGVRDAGGVKGVKVGAAWLEYSSRLVLEPGLIGGNFPCLRWSGLALKDLQTLIAKAGELMVFPHIDEWAAR